MAAETLLGIPNNLPLPLPGPIPIAKNSIVAIIRSRFTLADLKNIFFSPLSKIQNSRRTA
jgi:hypothetical protein